MTESTLLQLRERLELVRGSYNLDSPGHRAEGQLVDCLRRSGVEVEAASIEEDMLGKVDLWVRHPRQRIWYAVQLSTYSLVGGKGYQSLQRGIVPLYFSRAWIQKWEQADGEVCERMLKDFWDCFNAVLEGFPRVRFIRKGYA